MCPPEASPRPASADLNAERRRLVRSLRRAGVLTALLLAVVAGLAALAVHQAGEARERLWRSLLNQARSARVSGRPGARAEALRAVADAAKHRPAPEVRDEAVAALALDDLQPGAFTNLISGRDTAFAVGAQLDRIALAEPDGGIQLRGLWTEVPALRLPGSGEPVHYLFFSPDDRWLVARYESGRTRAWSVTDGAPGFALTDAGRVTTSRGTVRFLPEAPACCWLSDQAGRRLRLLDLEARRELETLPLEGVPGVLALTDRGELAVGVGPEVQVWNRAGPRQVRRLPFPSVVSALDWRPGLPELAVAGEGGQLELVAVNTGVRRPLAGHRSLINHIRFDATGARLFSTSWDGTTRFWDATLARPGLVTREGLALHYDAGGGRLAFYRGNNGVGFWQVVPSPVLRVFAAPAGVEHHFTDVALSPDGRRVAAVNRQALVVWDLAQRRLESQQTLPGGEGVAWSSDGTRLVTSSAAGLRRWEVLSLPPGLREAPPPTPGLAVHGRFHRVNPERLAAGGRGAAWWIEPWSEGAEPLRVPADALDTFAHVTADAAGRLVGSQWKGGATRVLGPTAGAAGTEIEPVGGFARFAPDGRTLLTGNNRGYRLWRTGDWQEQARLEQQLGSDFPGLAVFTADSRGVYLIHEHRRLTLAGVPDLQPRMSLEAPGDANLYALDLDPAGRRLVAGTDDQRVLVWDLEALRRELEGLGLPAWDSPVPARRLPGLTSVVAAAFLLATGLALHTLWRQRGLVRGYLHLESLAAARNRQLTEAREALLHGQKMQALGQITASVAHDLRNLLSVISLSNGLLQRGVARDPDLAEEAHAVNEAVERGRSLVLSLLGYSRRQEAGPGPADVAAVVRELLRLLGRKFFSGISLELDLPPELPPVAVPAAALEQVLINLLVNASEAMEGRGTLAVTAGLQAFPSGPGWMTVHLPPGDEVVVLTVRDSGPGIPPDVLPRIFEPFFTTKARGAAAGTGLGLSTVYAIAERQGLGLTVRSARGATEFVLGLPAVPAPTPRPD